jgi:hypothetical protein
MRAYRSAMTQLVLLTDAWGPKYGGINSFNTDLAKALGMAIGRHIQQKMLLGLHVQFTRKDQVTFFRTSRGPCGVSPYLMLPSVDMRLRWSVLKSA